LPELTKEKLVKMTLFWNDLLGTMCKTHSSLSYEKENRMKKRNWLVSLISGLLLGLLATSFGIAKDLIILPVVRAEDKIGEIRNLLLNSHTRWQTMRGETTTVWFNLQNNSRQVFHNSIVIANPNRAHLTITSQDGLSDTEWLGDGSKIFEIDRHSKTYRESTQKDVVHDLERIPVEVGAIDPEKIFRHPMAMMIPSPVVDYIFPTGLAQRQGVYTIIGEETIAQRKAWMIDYLNQTDQNEVTMKARYWVDQETGVILQAFTYSTEPESFGKLIESTSFSSIGFDQPVESAEFIPLLDGLQK
jgi:hypothetical protein